MKAKLLILSAIVAISLTTPAFAKRHVVQTRNGQAVVTNSGNHRNHWRGDHWRSGSSVFWNVGIGVPLYGGNYYYGSSYPYYSNRTGYRGYNGSVVARVQERLARAGYYRGPIDGLMGPRTRYAIRVYERTHGLPADGIIDRRLLATMGIA